MSVYFVQAWGRGGPGPIKVGSAENVDRRVAQLQVGCPERLVVLCDLPGLGRAEERRVHRRLSSHRIRGEWFRPDAEVLDLVDALREAYLEFGDGPVYRAQVKEVLDARTDEAGVR